MSKNSFELNLEKSKEQSYHENIEYRNSLFLKQEEDFRACARECIAEDMEKTLKNCKYECKYIFEDYAKKILNQYPDEARRLLKTFPNMPLYQYNYFHRRVDVPTSWKELMQGFQPKL